MKHQKKAVLTGIAALLIGSASYAAPVQFFGEDLGWVSNNNSTNADAAQADFLSNLSGVGVENLESFAPGNSAPLAVDFGAAGTATLNGGGSISNNNGGAGRRAYSGSNYWETSSGSNFVIDFSEAIAAFGFYGIDFGDFRGRIELTTSTGSIFEVPHSQGSGANGALVYWGIIDLDNLFTSISFTNTGSGADFFGFDDFTIGTAAQVGGGGVTPVPEPGMLGLMGLGLLGMGLSRRRKTA